MLTLLIVFIIASLIAYYQIYKDYRSVDADEITLCLIVGLLFVMIVGLPISFALRMDTRIKTYSYNIESLQDNNTTNAHFFIGSGYIEGKMKYTFYYEENGLYRMKQIDCNDAQIRYSDSIPKVIVNEIDLTKSIINYFSLDADIGDKTYIIEVPKGTIKNNYNLDAQ